MDNLTTIAPNPLSLALLDAIRLAHAHSLELADLQHRHDAIRDAYFVAVAMLTQRDKTLARSHAENIHLRAQLRAFISGRTVADERQAAELDAVADWTKSEAA